MCVGHVRWIFNVQRDKLVSMKLKISRCLLHLVTPGNRLFGFCFILSSLSLQISNVSSTELNSLYQWSQVSSEILFVPVTGLVFSNPGQFLHYVFDVFCTKWVLLHGICQKYIFYTCTCIQQFYCECTMLSSIVVCFSMDDKS